MGFTGLYFEKYYYRWFNCVFLFRKGTFDTFQQNEPICTVASRSNLVKWCWSIDDAKRLCSELNNKLREEK